MICRALLGFGLGAKASVTPIFCAEVSPSHLRGALVINWQLYDACGIFLGFSSGLLLSSTGLLSWRLQTASACVPTAALMLLIWTVPESPRWLLKKERFGDAFASMCALRHSPLEAAVELLYANEQVQLEIEFLPPESRERALEIRSDHDGPRLQRAAAATSYWLRIWQLFRDKRTRRATVAAAVVMICQQLCGVNIICFYGTTFFRDINGLGSSSAATNALWMSWGIGLANFVFAFPAYRWIDTRGRRFLLLVTYPGMTLAMLGACLSMLREDQSVRFALVCFFMFVFIFFYSFGQGPVAFAYASEVFPLLNREAGMSFSVFVNLTGAGILTLLVPQAQVTSNGPDFDGRTWQTVQVRLLAVFTVLNIVSFILIFCLVPDTAGATIRKEEGKMNYMSLEQLNYIFKIKTWEHTTQAWRRLTRSIGFADHGNTDVMWEDEKGNVFGEKATGSGNPLLQQEDHEDVAPDHIQSIPDLSSNAVIEGDVRSRRPVEDKIGKEVAVQTQEIEEVTSEKSSNGNSTDRHEDHEHDHLQNESDRVVIIDYLSALIKDLKEKTQ